MYSISFILKYITFVTIAGIVAIGYYRRLILTFRIFGKPKKRDFHKNPLPNSVGIVFAILFLIGSLPLIPYVKNIQTFLALFICLFFLSLIGFWDDLKIMNTKKKLVYQIILVIITVILNDLVLKNLHGFLGINEVPSLLGLLLSVFIGVFMVNAFNLIDGIDGLAGFISIIAFTSFAIIFWVLDYKFYFGLCLLLIGIILAYLPFNFSRKRKVFMGDSGSLFIGFIIFIMTMIVVTNMEPIDTSLIHRSILPIAPMTIFLVPMVDSLSIYIYRLSLGVSPFAPDRLHIHHLALRITNSHLMSSIGISSIKLFLIAMFSYLAFQMHHSYFIGLFFGVFFGLVFFTIYLRIRLKRIARKKYHERYPYIQG